MLQFRTVFFLRMGIWQRRILVNRFRKNLGDSPQIWNGLADSTNNGPVVNFLRLAHTKTMDKPNGYSQEAMEKSLGNTRNRQNSLIKPDPRT